MVIGLIKMLIIFRKVCVNRLCRLEIFEMGIPRIIFPIETPLLIRSKNT